MTHYPTLLDECRIIANARRDIRGSALTADDFQVIAVEVCMANGVQNETVVLMLVDDLTEHYETIS
jgi:hypothetical protein